MAAICVATIVAAAIPEAPVPPINPCLAPTEIAPWLGSVLTGISFASDDVTGDDGWEEPRDLSGDINVFEDLDCTAAGVDLNLGHEDSPFVWSTGDRLQFAYTQDTQRDYLTGQPAVIDPYESFHCIGAARQGQSGYAFDIHEAFIVEQPEDDCDPSCQPCAKTIDRSVDRWTAFPSNVNIERRQVVTSDPEYGVDEGSPAVAPEFLGSGTVMVFARYEGTSNAGDLYMSKNPTSGTSYDPFDWGAPTKFPSGTTGTTPPNTTANPAINTPCIEDNPHTVNNVLYWDSNRDPAKTTWDGTEDCLDEEERSIWYAYWVLWPVGHWVGPVQLGGVDLANSTFNRDIFITTDAQTAYWISDQSTTCWQDLDGDTTKDADEQAHSCLYRADWDSTDRGVQRQPHHDRRAEAGWTVRSAAGAGRARRCRSDRRALGHRGRTIPVLRISSARGASRRARRRSLRHVHRRCAIRR